MLMHQHICTHEKECLRLRNLLSEASMLSMSFERDWRHSLQGLLNNAMETIDSCSGHHVCPEPTAPALETAEGLIGEWPDRVTQFRREI